MSSKPSLNIAVVILAAGASKRMGVPKQLLNWGHKTMLGHALGTALKLQTAEIIVVLGANYPEIIKEIYHYPVTVLNNKDWKKGLGKSIACAANYLLSSKHSFDGLLITLADQPFIDSEFLNTLIKKFEINKKLIVTTSYEKGIQGVPVIFDSVYFKELSFLNEDKGAKFLFENYKNHIKSVVPKEKNIDLDSWDHYYKVYKENFSD